MRCWGEACERAHHHTPEPFRRAFPSPAGSGDLTLGCESAHPLLSIWAQSPSARITQSPSKRPYSAGLRHSARGRGGHLPAAFCSLHATCITTPGPHRLRAGSNVCYSHFTGEDTEARSGGAQSSHNSAPGAGHTQPRTPSFGFLSCGLCTRPNCLC